MEPMIDRRQQGDSVFWYVVQDPDFFDDLRASGSREFSQVIERFVPAGWKIATSGIWTHVYPPDAKLLPQGFKIHISATTASAIQVLEKVAPIFAARSTPFKYMADPQILEFATCKNYWSGGSGKFITVYPRDNEDFASLIATLDQATKDLEGPYILSDKRYGDSKVLFYRYGGIAPRSVLNVFGEKVMVIEDKDGRLVPDIRTPYFELPEGIQDPFPSEEKHEGEVWLKNRYRVTGVLKLSNAGGVYEAQDQETGQTVIVKEARPHVNVTRANRNDAVAMLRKEAALLRKLEATGYVPKVVDLFQEWEHLFLVEEFVAGMPLSSFRAVKTVALVIQNLPPTEERVKTFCGRIYTIARKLIAALDACHREGVLMGDLSPHNVLVDDDLNLKLIDFEAASVPGDSESAGLGMFTPGFSSTKRMSGNDLSPDDDFFSLGSTIYSLLIPVQEYFSLNPAGAELFMDEVTRDFRLPHAFRELISALVNGDVNRARAIVDPENTLSLELSPAVERPGSVAPEIPQMIDGIARFIVSKTDAGRESRLWPSDYRLFSTNPMNVAYGALGTAYFLKAALGELPAETRRWIDRQPLSLDDYPPGLFVGLSGIAWTLAELGFDDKARTAIDLAFKSPLLFDAPDLFYGAAGTGLASLYFFRKTGERRFLERACELGDSILSRAATDENGYYWTNVDEVAYLGYAHGGSGIALFLLYLYHASEDPKYLAYALGALEYEIANANSDNDQLAWGRIRNEPQDSPYWRFGTSGVGSVLIRFYAYLGERRYLELARKAAASAALKYTVFPTQFIGLSGVGEFLIDMYCFTGEQKYLNDAYRVAEGVRLFQIDRPEGIAFPGEELLRISTDFGTGSAGIGMFLLRLLRPGGRLFYEFDALNRTPFEAKSEQPVLSASSS